MALDPNSGAALNYLTTLQTVIGRLATQSSNCKTWCAPLVFASFALFVGTDNSDVLLLALIPLTMFLLLDAYYLGLERAFRLRYNEFAERLRQDKAEASELFLMPPGTVGARLRGTIVAATSPAIWPFYGTIGGLLLLVRWVTC